MVSAEGGLRRFMHVRLVKAATNGNVEEMERLINDEDEAVLLGETERRSNCVHIASIYGRTDFCARVLQRLINSRDPSSVSSLLSATNSDDETPLLTAVKNGRKSLARQLLTVYVGHGLHGAIQSRDGHGSNVLHYAIRNGNKELALELIQAEPALSGHTNKNNSHPCSEYDGTNASNALHAAVKYNDAYFARELVQQRAGVVRRLAFQKDRKGDTPMHLTAHFNRVEILEIILDFDQSLEYVISEPNSDVPLLFSAASRGHVGFARALLKYCPDAPYSNKIGKPCLHEAVYHNQMEFVQFILEENSSLRKLVNMQLMVEVEHELRYDGTALHLAVEKCNPKMVRALLHHPDIDITVINEKNCAAIWKLSHSDNYAKTINWETINWNKIFWLILQKDYKAETDMHNLHEEIKKMKAVKSLTETYIGNTSLVAILIATITFAAAFTLPGGYSSSAESEGLPIMARKVAFQAFLIFDTLGMCSSLAVAFICVIARWMDFEFLLHYRSWTKKLMSFAYMTTTLAFATGLYTVLFPRVHWLAIAICVLSVSLPILITLISEWPILLLRFRYCGKPFNADFIEMILSHCLLDATNAWNLFEAHIKSHCLLLVYGLMTSGSLDDHLYSMSTTTNTLTWPVRYNIILKTVGWGLRCCTLHQEWKQCVVHRNIKPSNVMLDPSFNAKLGDFGLARLSATHTTVLASTKGYMDPESVVGVA
ncbi:hypothetical protein U9M48_000828 [Paspalum notatum var. saurae]|uniref:Protein kinase domain-containing protein n=1 Tax=Paspalum notatum var. saurae TaxID=547442 RepID=A0AAQ3SHP0_PASNO